MKLAIILKIAPRGEPLCRSKVRLLIGLSILPGDIPSYWKVCPSLDCFDEAKTYTFQNKPLERIHFLRRPRTAQWDRQLAQTYLTNVFVHLMCFRAKLQIFRHFTIVENEHRSYRFETWIKFQRIIVARVFS